MTLINIFADTRGKARCRSCNAPIEWAEITPSGKKMPFDGEIVPVKSHHDPAGRLVETVDTTVTTSHFATCKDADKWRRKK